MRDKKVSDAWERIRFASKWTFDFFFLFFFWFRSFTISMDIDGQHRTWYCEMWPAEAIAQFERGGQEAVKERWSKNEKQKTKAERTETKKYERSSSVIENCGKHLSQNSKNDVSLMLGVSYVDCGGYQFVAIYDDEIDAIRAGNQKRRNMSCLWLTADGQ